MSIIRIIAVDPNPHKPKPGKPVDDIVVYQVPEHSRAYELLIEMLNSAKIDHAELLSDRPPKPPKEKKPRKRKSSEKVQTTNT